MRTADDLPRSATRRSAGDEAALYIRRLIFDGVLTPGERVPQDQIAEALGISRIPVREALIGLEREGWVRIELNRGAFINAFDQAAVLDHYALYGMVYAFAVQRAIERSPGGELASSLATLAGEVKRCRDPQAFHGLALAFHHAVLDSAESRPSETVAAALVRLVPGDFFATVPRAMAVERRYLPMVARHVATGDGGAASEAYTEMMSQIGPLVLKVFNDRGLIARKG